MWLDWLFILQSINYPTKCTQALFKAHPDGEKFLDTDLNGDSRIDLVVANKGSPGISIWFANSDGSFQPETTVGSGLSYANVKLTDVDGDGLSDILAMSANQIDYYRAVTMQTPDKNIFFPGVGDFAIGNLNFSAAVDYVLIPSGSNTASSYVYSGGDFGLSKSDFYRLVNGGTQAVVDDLTDDGISDVAIGEKNTKSVAVCRGDSSLELICSEPIINLAGEPTFLTTLPLADVSQRVLVLGEQVTSSGFITAWSIGSDGSATKTFDTSLSDAPIAIFGADLDCDGLKDIVVYVAHENQLSVYANLGDGTFSTTPETLSLGLDLGTGNLSDLYAMTLADLNNDSKPDLIALKNNSITKSRAILHNTSD